MSYHIHLHFEKKDEYETGHKSKWREIDLLCSDEQYIIKRLLIRKCDWAYSYKRDLIDCNIYDTTTVIDIENNIKHFEAELKLIGNFKEIVKSEPKYLYGKLCSMYYDIELSLQDFFPHRCEMFQNSLGVVCRANQYESFCLIFDEIGCLYSLPKTSNVSLGDVIIFSTKWDKESRSITLCDSYCDIKCYDSKQKTINFSPRESLLLQRYNNNAMEAIDFINFFSDSETIKRYIDSLDIPAIINSYKIEINDCNIVRHYDEKMRKITKTIDTNDSYIRNLFPLNKEEFIWEYSYGDEILDHYIDVERMQILKNNASKSYSKFAHYNYLMEERLNKQMDLVILDDLIKKHWPLQHYIRMQNVISESKIGEFIYNHNNLILQYPSDVKCSFSA